jgi:hypothetical protein
MVTTMPKVDLDFQRYVERRKGAREAQTREGAAYAYAGDLKVLRTLDRVRPVRLASEGAVRLWQGQARAELLGEALRVSAKERPELLTLAQRAGEALHVAVPSLYVAVIERPALAFGSNEDASVLFGRGKVEALSELELLHAVGAELGRIQNNHVVYVTARYHLEHFANRFVQWIVGPALRALRAWDKRAEVTADRAGLLCTRDLAASEAAIHKLAPDEATAERRVRALRLFAESAYYRGMRGEEGGLSGTECDAQVAEAIA